MGDPSPTFKRAALHGGSEPEDGHRYQDRGGPRDAPNPEYRDKGNLRDGADTNPNARVHLLGGSAGYDGSAASTSEARKHQHYARPGQVSFDEGRHELATYEAKSLGRLGGEGRSSIDQLAAGVVRGMDVGLCWKGGP